MSLSSLTPSYLDTIFLLTGMVNEFDYDLNYGGQTMTFGPEELLFKGATMNQVGDDEVDITYMFSATPSLTEDDDPPYEVGDSGPIAITGWNYPWAYFVETPDAGSGLMVRRAIAVYIERVFMLADFDVLAL